MIYNDSDDSPHEIQNAHVDYPYGTMYTKLQTFLPLKVQ